MLIHLVQYLLVSTSLSAGSGQEPVSIYITFVCYVVIMFMSTSYLFHVVVCKMFGLFSKDLD